MGVVNVTPDSFSDGNIFFHADAAIQRAMELVAMGADILDVGGESTRPGAVPVTPAEERRRVMPVIEALASGVSVPISIDTRHEEVAMAAIHAGASIVNDIEAGRSQRGMWRVVRDAGAGYVCMHMQGEPATMQRNPSYRDVVSEVRGFLAERVAELASFGIDPECVAIDPGIGFGKDLGHNLALLRALPDLVGLGQPVLLGVSRKGFIGTVTHAPEMADRLAGGLACALHAAQCGVSVIRTHDVAETIRALKMLAVLQPMEPLP